MDGIDAVIVSVAVAILASLLLRLLPLRPMGRAGDTADRLRQLEARYAELSTQHRQVQAEYQNKLVEYTSAYTAWMQREAEYLERIRVLENRVRQLETLAGVKTTPENELLVVGIWPDADDLDTDAEASAIYDSGIEYRRISGDNATRSGIIRELNRHTNGHRLIVEVGAHGAAMGTQLVNGDIVPPGWWRRVLQGRAVELAVLLSCESDTIADALVAEGIPHVISVQDQIRDEDATAFAAALYERLSRGDDVPKAVDMAKLHVSSDGAEMISVRKGKHA